MEKTQIHTLRDIVDFAAQSYGTRAAIKYKEKKEIIEKTFLDVKSDTERWSGTLEKNGLRGKHVAVIGPTSYEWIITYLGTVNSGGVIVPLDRELPAADLCELIDRADVSAFVYDSLYTDAARMVRERCPGVTHFFCMQQESNEALSLSFWKALAENSAYDPPVLDPEKMCAILFTSGTTGKSKGVMLSHLNLTNNVVCDDMGMMGQNNTILSVLPIHHAYCFTCDILLGLYLGATICINDSIMHVVKNLQLFKPTIVLLVPMIVQSMYEKLSAAIKSAGLLPKKMVVHKALGGKLRMIVSGGAYLNPELVGEFEKLGITLLQGYGMTESAPRISSNHEGSIRAESVGQLIPGCQAKIVDGEIWVKGPSVMLGYYQDPEETAKTLVDGWLRTGDLGRLDEEGFLYITGRIKNLIILSNGENVSPEELENNLTSSPLVKEALVYTENGTITAEIFPDFEYAQTKKIADPNEKINALVEQMNQELPLFKRVYNVRFREVEFEKTTSKKIKRQQHAVGPDKKSDT